MEIKAITERARELLVKSPNLSRALTSLSERNAYEELAVRQLSRYYSDEKILVAAWQFARATNDFRKGMARARELVDPAWGVDNMLAFMEGGVSEGVLKTSVLHAMLREGILSHVSQQKRSVVERRGLLGARQILKGRLNQKDGMSEDYQRAATEMVRLLDARLAGDDQNDVPVPSNKLLPKT